MSWVSYCLGMRESPFWRSCGFSADVDDDTDSVVSNTETDTLHWSLDYEEALAMAETDMEQSRRRALLVRHHNLIFESHS